MGCDVPMIYLRYGGCYVAAAMWQPEGGPCHPPLGPFSRRHCCAMPGEQLI